MHEPNEFNLTFFILYWIVSGIAVLLTSKLVRGFRVGGFLSAILAALVLGAANAVLWPVIFVLTLPLTIVTLGLFLFVVNGIVLKICAALLPGFHIDSWWAAIWGSVVLASVNWALHFFLI